MLAFDGHNDTLQRFSDERAFLEGAPELAIDLPRARAGGLAAGMFAMFVPTDDGEPQVGVYAGPLDRSTAAEATRGMIALAERVVAAADGAVRIVRDVAALDACHSEGALGMVLHIEGAEALDPELGDLEDWYRAGLRSLGPVWSRQNDFAYGVPFGFPSSPNLGPGLTDAGKRLVARCNELGILVDLSHMNEAGFWDTAEASSAPLVASHSCVHALAPSSRNLTDEQLDAIADSGGMVGINFAVIFVRSDGANDPDTPLADVVRHIAYVAERNGIDHVGLGSDLDGAPMPTTLASIDALPALFDGMRAAGFDEAEIEQFAWGNWRRVLGATWKD